MESISRILPRKISLREPQGASVANSSLRLDVACRLGGRGASNAVVAIACIAPAIVGAGGVVTIIDVYGSESCRAELLRWVPDSPKETLFDRRESGIARIGSDTRAPRAHAVNM